MSENTLLKDKNVLICIGQIVNSDLYDNIKKNFCGTVFLNIKDFDNYNCLSDAIIYLCGDIAQIDIQNKTVYVIKDLSCNYGNHQLVDIGEVPINVHNVGVYFRKFFENKNYFDLIDGEHNFQTLTESNKQSNAFRTGIYLTKVEKINDDIKFRLLRCSSNLNGPTDNFRKTDNEIVNKVNNIAEHFFEEKTELNHVLAQIYKNKIVDGSVEKKAKIKDHSDKTKDMPRNGLMAFCTFYKFTDPELKHIKKSDDDPYDYCYNKTSVLTKLRFRLKKMDTCSTLTKLFDITLYPNSVFIMSLSMNRLYTHEIVPSTLPVDKIPTRMGYVIRCSKTAAVFRNNQTYIYDGSYIPLEQPNEKEVKRLKDLYFQENTTSNLIQYDGFYFSLNEGDYEQPIV